MTYLLFHVALSSLTISDRESRIARKGLKIPTAACARVRSVDPTFQQRSNKETYKSNVEENVFKLTDCACAMTFHL